jgi:integrase/recombinase XerD
MTSSTFGAYARAVERWSTGAMDDDVLAAFAAYQRAQGLAPATIKNRHSIASGIPRRLGVSLLTASTAHLRDHVGRDGVSLGTRRTERAALVAFYAFAVEEGYRDDDPTMRLPKIRAPRGAARPFSQDQICRMLESGAYARTRAMILLGYYQGFRVSSISRVHGRDVDLESQTISTVAKGSKRLTLPLHPVIAELARDMPADDWWFPSDQLEQGHIRSGTVTDAVRDAKRRAGITDPTLTAHSLRHAFGTDLVDAGVDIRVIADLMGHESVATTQIYTRVSAERRRDGLNQLHGVVAPSRSGRRRTEAHSERKAA